MSDSRSRTLRFAPMRLAAAALLVAVARPAAANPPPPAPAIAAVAPARPPVVPARVAARRTSGLEAVEHFAAVHTLGVLIAAVLTYLCCHPVFAFCRRGWIIKRQDILSSLGEASKLIYLQTFLVRENGKRITSSTEAAKEFAEMYSWQYGRYRLVIPTILLVLVVATLSFPLAETALRVALGNRVSPELLDLAPKATAAIAGAYAWVVYGLIKSAERYDLPPGTILGAALRLAIAVPLGDAISALVSDALGPFIAFAVGAFPLATLELVFKRLATDRLKLDLLPDSQPDQVKVLDGVDTMTSDRLAAAGVTTVTALAYCDPVQVSMRTNITFDAILNLVNQALAYIYLGVRMNDLRVVGLRGAVEIRHLLHAMRHGAADVRATAQAAFVSAVAAANASQDQKSGFLIDAAGLRRAFHEIGEDPRTIFLEAIWEANAKIVGGDDSSVPHVVRVAPAPPLARKPTRRRRWRPSPSLSPIVR